MYTAWSGTRFICLQMLIETEADQEMSDEPDSLMDRALVGLISSYRRSFVRTLYNMQLTSIQARTPAANRKLATF